MTHHLTFGPKANRLSFPQKSFSDKITTHRNHHSLFFLYSFGTIKMATQTERPSIKTMPKEIIRHIIVEEIGEELVLKANGEGYAKLMRVCHNFRDVLYDKRLKKRMMESMITALYGRIRWMDSMDNSTCYRM